MVDALTEIGRASVGSVWVPVLAWTALAGSSEVVLRVARVHASAAVHVRSALIVALPLSLLVPAAVAAWWPEAASAVATLRPQTLVLPEITVGEAPDPSAPRRAPGWLALGLVTVALALAGVVGLARWARSLAGLRGVRRGLAPAPGPLQYQLEAARDALGVRTPVVAALCPSGTAPFTFGWRRPVVAVPPGLSGETLRLALAHELAHVRRRDFLWNAVDHAAAGVGLAHPLTHVLVRRTALGREQAADAAVLAGRPDQRRAYADLLLSYASLPAPGLSLGASQGSSPLESRITAMTHTPSALRLDQLTRLGRGVGLLALLVLVGSAAALAVPGSPAAPGAATLLASNDSLVHHVERIDVAEETSGRPRIDIYLKRGSPEGTAEAIARQLGDDEGEIDLVVYGDDGKALRRRVSSRKLGPLNALRSTREAPLEGRVTDASTGSGIAGASLQVEGTTLGAATDRDGDYRLDAPDEPFSLRVSAPGYIPYVVDVAAGKTSLDVALRPSTSDVARRGPSDGDLGPEAPDVFEIVEDPPTLVGGLRALQERVVYPDLARRAGISGRVFITFVVDVDGSVTDARVERSPDDALSEAALDAIRASRFTPGKQRGIPVKVRYTVPVNFALPDSGPSKSDDLGERFPDARLRLEGVDRSVFGSPGLVESLLVANGRILRSSQPALRDGAQAVVTVEVNDEGLIDGEYRVATENDALRDFARSFVGFIALPAPELAGQTLEYTVTYVRGD